MGAGLDTLLGTLDLERLEVNLFRGSSPQAGWQRVFGGQVVGQALVAGQRTVEAARSIHSLHGYFIRPGDPKVPIIYEVARDRDGKSFTTRRVIAIQHGNPIFSMLASFHAAEDGFAHEMPMPKVPTPEELPGENWVLTPLTVTFPLEILLTMMLSLPLVPVMTRVCDEFTEAETASMRRASSFSKPASAARKGPEEILSFALKRWSRTSRVPLICARPATGCGIADVIGARSRSRATISKCAGLRSRSSAFAGS